jgi:hypothetical protein
VTDLGVGWGFWGSEVVVGQGHPCERGVWGLRDGGQARPGGRPFGGKRLDSRPAAPGLALYRRDGPEWMSSWLGLWLGFRWRHVVGCRVGLLVQWVIGAPSACRVGF